MVTPKIASAHLFSHLNKLVYPSIEKGVALGNSDSFDPLEI